MYKKIFVTIDNSHHSNQCVNLAIRLSKKFNSHLIGCHVYDATLHQRRFRDMEKGLPPQYQDENVLKKQRDLHMSLINSGLKLISESYLDVFRNKCKEADVSHECLLLEGKNYYEIIKEVQKNYYDLVVMGSQGLAAVNEHVIGSVCERVVRRINTDVLIVKNSSLDGKVVVAVDGSTLSNAGVKSAIEFVGLFNLELTAISVFDPHYHRVAFESIAKVLSKEAGQIFRFREQETLHEEIIDKGLAKIYQNHLDHAGCMAEDTGIKINKILKDGKPYEQILKYINAEKTSLLIVGRTGIHNSNGLDIGSTAENLLRLSPCNILLTGGNKEAKPELFNVFQEIRNISTKKESNTGFNVIQSVELNSNAVKELDCVKSTVKEYNSVIWTKEAQMQTERIPSFIRDVVRAKIEDFARENGYREITTKIVDEARTNLMANDSLHKIIPK